MSELLALVSIQLHVPVFSNQFQWKSISVSLIPQVIPQVAYKGFRVSTLIFNLNNYYIPFITSTSKIKMHFFSLQLNMTIYTQIFQTGG